MCRFILVAALAVLSAKNTDAQVESYEQIRNIAIEMRQTCIGSDAALCSSTRSYNPKFPEDIGALVRATCNLEQTVGSVPFRYGVQCWKAVTKFLIQYEVPLRSPDELTKYEMGLTLSVCEYLPKYDPDGESDVQTSDGVEHANYDLWRDNCFIKGLRVLSDQKNRRGPLAELILQSCPSGTICSEAYAFGLKKAMEVDLPSSPFENFKNDLSVEQASCEQTPDSIFRGPLITSPDFNPQQSCFANGLPTIAFNGISTQTILAGCGVDLGFDGTPACYKRAIKYLTKYSLPSDDHDRVKYVAGMILGMCKSDQCISKSVESLVNNNTEEGVEIHPENISTNLRAFFAARDTWAHFKTAYDNY